VFRKHYILFLLLAAAFIGCSLVDEDMSDCGTDYNLDYTLTLVTNVSTEISTELETTISTELELSAALAIREYLKDVFTDYAHDVDLSFYDVVGDSLRLHHEEHIMDANQSSYTLHIPVHHYMHTALANVLNNDIVEVQDGERCHNEKLHQVVGDTLSSHTTGLFTARLPMNIQEGVSQNFNVHLYMANAATAVVIDTVGSHIKDLNLFATGFATDFSVCDSLYYFNDDPVFRMDKLALEESGGYCFSSIHFPSRNPEDTKVIIDSQDPFVSEDATYSLWQIRAYATLADGTVTETILSVWNPLMAGQLRIIKAKANKDGSLAPGKPTVGVSVTLDWQSGMEHEVPL
jgi:hypothetical protein